MATHVELLLQILEGSNFHLLDPDSTIIFKGMLDRVMLSSDPIPVSSKSGLHLEIGEEMIWKMSQRSYKRIKMTKALKLECFNLTTSGAKNNIGYIIMSLKAVTDSSASTLGWRRLLGTNTSSHNCPQLHLSLSVKDEKADTQQALSPPLSLDTSNKEPQLFVKNGMTYIGSERFCTKRFQLTCVLNTAINLALLLPDKNKKYCIQILVLGQPLTSSMFEYPASLTDFRQTFVFDIMSSEDILCQYLKENMSLEMSITSKEDETYGSCKQYVDSLQPGNTVQLTCYMTQDGMNSHDKSSNYPSVELTLSLINLDNKSNSNVPVKIVTPRLIEINDNQIDDSSKKTTHGRPTSTSPPQTPELIDLANDSVVIKEECNLTPRLENPPQHSDSTKHNQENFDFALDLDSMNLNNVGATTRVNITRGNEHVVSQNIGQAPAQNHVQQEEVRNATQYSARSATSSKDLEFNLNLAGLKFTDNQCVGQNNSTRLSNSELLAKCVEELEEWKFRQKILFTEELKQQKEQLIVCWEEEQKIRAAAQEKAREEEVKHAEQLTAQLDQELRTMHHKIEELKSEEEKFRKLSATLQEKYSRKVKAHQTQMRDAKAKLEAMSLRNKQLQQQIGVLQNENQRLLSKSQGSESAQLAEMKEKVRVLEKKMLKTEREKAELVKKWIVSQQEGRQMQSQTASSSSRLNAPGMSSKHRLQQTLEEERNQLLTEKARLEQLRHELDNLRLICSPDMEADQVINAENIAEASETSCSHLRRLQHERNELLHSGLYNQDHEIIKQIEQAIQHGMNA